MPDSRLIGKEIQERMMPLVFERGMTVVEGGTFEGHCTAICERITGKPLASYEPVESSAIKARSYLASQGLNSAIIVCAIAPSYSRRDAHVLDRGAASRLQTSSIGKSVPWVLLDTAISLSGATGVMLDIEGAETDVICGSTLSGIKAILVEIHDTPKNFSKIDAWLEALGFDLVGTEIRVADESGYNAVACWRRDVVL